MPRLEIRVGNSIDTLYPISINATQPTAVQSDSFDGFISVHIRDHDPPSNLLEQINHDNAFCIAVTGRFLIQGMTTDDILFGNQFERPLRLPTGTSLALRFAQWFDPGLEANLYATEPHAFSPLVVTMNRLQVRHDALTIAAKEFSHRVINEDMSAVVQGLTTDTKHRRSYFANTANRRDVVVAPNQVWSMVFTNPYIDFNKFVVHLPMLDVDVLKYWDGQPLRYYAKTRDDMSIFFIVEFNLIQDDH